MTTYGTIPTSAHPEDPSGLAFISRAKARGRSALATRRPWKEMAHLHAFGLPHSISDAYLSVRTNIGYFTMNYAIVALVIIFLSLLWHPISLIVFLVMMALWLFLYFLRDEEVVVFGRVIDDNIVLAVLSVVTIVALLFTGATWNIVCSVLSAVVVVLIHAVFRNTDDLCLDEEAAGGGWFTVVGGGNAGPLPSSSSSSSSK